MSVVQIAAKARRALAWWMTSSRQQRERRLSDRFDSCTAGAVLVDRDTLVPVVVLDLSEKGARLYSRFPLGDNPRVSCTVGKGASAAWLDLAIVWQRSTSNGWEYGTSLIARRGQTRLDLAVLIAIHCVMRLARPNRLAC
jgi:hypothetical protein